MILAKYRKEPWLVTHRSQPGQDVLGLMRTATFCLQPPGDTLTRAAFYQSILSGCIPVVFRNDDAFWAQWAFSDAIPYRRIAHVVPERAVLDGVDFVPSLHLPSAEIQARREMMRNWSGWLDYRREAVGAILTVLTARRARKRENGRELKPLLSCFESPLAQATWGGRRCMSLRPMLCEKVSSCNARATGHYRAHHRSE